MLISREVVERVTRSLFGADTAVALRVLDSYGTDLPERGRVQLAVLKLSQGELSRLSEMVTLAKNDYRDALVAAEYPEEFIVRDYRLSEDEQELPLVRARDRDRAQYLAWLDKHAPGEGAT